MGTGETVPGEGLPVPYRNYVPKKFSKRSEALIDYANHIIGIYRQQGYTLTLRQLYYQMVAKDVLANTPQEYKSLGSLVNDARLAGRIDWLAIEDRTRNLAPVPQWSSPLELLGDVVAGYRLEHWDDQPEYIEVWVEKEALAGVVAAACAPLYVPYFCCRGYTSASEMWAAARRFIDRPHQESIILHLGDHDPSGMDMTRDIIDRLAIFGAEVQVDRIALNMDQIEQYSPPPNPAKTTDARFSSYAEEYGDESWELDALEPSVLVGLIKETIEGHIDVDIWDQTEEVQKQHIARLKEVYDGFKLP